MSKAPDRGAATVRILSLGCAKNSVDAEVMAGLLSDEGYRVVAGGRADVAIVNTCGFIRDAKEESIEAILLLARQKARGRYRRLVVAGCMAKRYRDDLPALMPEVDLFVGPGDLPAIPALVGGLFAGDAPRECVGDGAVPEEACRRRALPGSPSAYLKIVEGCRHGCAYCTIPAIRGPLASRPRAALVEEARRLAGSGAREIVLIGHDITSYGRDRGERGALVQLVREICAVRGVRWVRLLYLHPAGIDDELVELVATEKKVCRYLDIPVQHVDPGVLRRMGRPYGGDGIRRLVASLRARIPGVFLRTSLIAGFPGESRRAFDELLRFVVESRWDYLGVFPYSREEGTRAHGMRPQIPEAVRRERAEIVRAAQADIARERNAGMVGREVEVLVEELRSGGRAAGRHRGQAPEVDGTVLLAGVQGPAGRFARARITGFRGCDLFAKPVDRKPGAGILT